MQESHAEASSYVHECAIALFQLNMTSAFKMPRCRPKVALSDSSVCHCWRLYIHNSCLVATKLTPQNTGQVAADKPDSLSADVTPAANHRWCSAENRTRQQALRSALRSLDWESDRSIQIHFCTLQRLLSQ